MRYILNIIFLLIVAGTISSCGNNSGNSPASNININNTRSVDSTTILKLMKEVYSWHDAHVNEIDYDVISRDSFQIGIDSTDLMKHIDQLTKTRFFTDHFIATYKKIGYLADSTLRSGKYYNEINFNFQDADPWTFFQDDAGHYWEHLIISNFKLNGDNASLAWRIEGITYNYPIRFKKTNDGWKVDYMQGFDEKVF